MVSQGVGEWVSGVKPQQAGIWKSSIQHADQYTQHLLLVCYEMVSVEHRSYILTFTGTSNKVCTYKPTLFIEIKICIHPL